MDRDERPPMDSPAELYHEASSLQASDVSIGRTVWSVNNSATIRRVVAGPASSYRGRPVIDLTAGCDLPDARLSDVLLRRRSVHTFAGEPLTPAELSALMYYSAAVATTDLDSFGITWGLRCAPSGGALFPLDVYCAVLDVSGTAAGLYAFEPAAHALHLLRPGGLAATLAEATYLRSTVETSAVCVLLVGNFPRTKFKYGERGYRFALLEAGHVAQNLLIVAEALGLAALPVGGFVDAAINELVGANGCDQAALYAVLLGRRAAEGTPAHVPPA